MQKIIFDDEITIWWQEKGNDTATRLTKLYLDGEYHGETKKTHYTFRIMRFSFTGITVLLQRLCICHMQHYVPE